MSISVFLADDHAVVRDGLERSRDRFKVIGQPSG